MKTPFFYLKRVSLFIGVCLLTFLSHNIHAIVVTVTNLNANGAGSFDDAIEQVNGAGAGPHTINFAAPAGTITIANAVINVDDVTINGDPNITIDGSGTEITDVPFSFTWITSLLYIDGSNIVINDLVLTNSAQYGILIAGGPFGGPAPSNITIDGCSISNSTLAGINNDIWAGGAANTPNILSDLTITNCDIFDNGSNAAGCDGISLAWADNVTITNNTVHHNEDHGIFFNGGWKACGGCQRGVTNAVVTGNSCTYNGVENTATVAWADTEGGGITLEDQSDDNLIENNICDNNSEHGIWLRADCDSDTIRSNQCNNNGFNGAGLACGVILALGGCDNNVIESNECDGNENHGIYIYNNSGTDNTNNLIQDNELKNNGEHGVSMMNSTSNTIQNNFIGTDNTGTTTEGNGGSGIYFRNSCNTNSIVGNIIVNNTGDGILLSEGVVDNTGTVTVNPGSCSQNDIEGNRIGINGAGAAAGNTGRGIALESCDQNYINGTTGNGPNYVSNNVSQGIQIITSTDNEIFGNYIGVDIAGTGDMGNQFEGVNLTNSDGNFIGGSLAGQGNVISGNAGNGITLENSDDNDIYGNIVGLNATGTAAIPNDFEGVSVNNGSLNNRVGNTGANEGNIIGGNTQNGISLQLAGAGNTIRNNIVGGDITGLIGIGNGFHGIALNGATGTIVGGSNPNERNYVFSNTGQVWSSGIQIENGATLNEVYGNFIGLNVNGAAVANSASGINLFINADNNTIGGPGDSLNIISGHNAAGGAGISFQQGSDNNIIQGNYIGTDTLGTTAIPNNNGIYIDASTGNTIGGINSSFGNIISGNSSNGISTNDADNNIISANCIGIDAAGASLGNGGHGVFINAGSDGNMIGGSTTGERNFISNNTFHGVYIDNSASNDVAGNYIGTDKTGLVDMGNNEHGVYIATGGSLNTIGGTSANERNLISGNNLEGVMISASSDNTVSANYIGTDVTGLASLANGLNGVLIQLASANNIIGGTTAGERNVISGNLSNGVGINGALDNFVLGNYIGLNATGNDSVPNNFAGVSIDGGSTGNQVGGLQDSANVISGNRQSGVWVNASTDNSIIGNTIGLQDGGMAILGNINNGVTIQAASHNTQVTSNLISGNGAVANGVAQPDNQGVGVYGLNSNNLTITRNYIGTDATGNDSIPNMMHGIHIDGSDGTVVGGGIIDRNIVSGNGSFYSLNEDQFCTGQGGQSKGNGIDFRNSSNVTISGNLVGIALDNSMLGNNENGIHLINTTGARIGGSGDSSNFVGNNVYKGIILNAASGNTIVGNMSGTDTTGTLDYGNGTGKTGDVVWDGCGGGTQFVGGSGIMLMSGASSNIVGGAGDLRNIISGNTEAGIWIQLSSDNNQILNNYIGTDVNGTAAIPNDDNGVIVWGTAGNQIGASGLGNLISGNTDNGIYMPNWVVNTSVDVEDNIIGLDASGTAALPNTLNGVHVQGAHLLTNIGTTTAGNVIAGNSDDGVLVDASAGGSIVIQNNTIGLNATGDDAIPNDSNGVQLNASSGVQVGTTTAGNTISGNGENGIYITNGADNNSIFNNNIGTQVNGTDSLLTTNSNTIGIYIDGGTQNAIGGTNAGEANIIATNEDDGIQITDGNVDNPIRRNSFFCNGGRGIEENSTGNDKGNGAPAFWSTLPPMGIETTGATDVFCFEFTGILPPNAIVEIYQMGPCQACGDSVQGQTYIDQTIVDGTGNISYDFGAKIAPADYNSYIYTITEDPGGLVSTSEFSPCSYEKVPPCTDPAAVITPQGSTTICQGDSVELEAPFDATHLYTWFESSAPGTPLNGAGNVAGDNVFYATAAGDYQVTIVDQTCDSTSAPVTVTVDPLQTTPDAGPDDTICVSNLPYTLQGNVVANGTWVDMNSVGATFNPDANTENAQVNNLPAGATTSLIWESASNLGICPVLRDTVAITIDEVADTPDAGADDTICVSNLAYTLSGNAITNGTWLDINAVGATFTPDANTATADVDNLPAGATATLVWESVSDLGFCPTLTDTVEITIDQVADTPDAGVDDSLCVSNLGYTLGGNAITTGTWLDINAVGATFTPDANTATADVDNIPAGTTTTLVWESTSNLGFCPALTDTVEITVDDVADTPLAGADDQICVSELSYTLGGNAITSGTWLDINAVGATFSPDANTATADVDNLPAGSATSLVWQSFSALGLCPNLTDTVEITVDDVPEAANGNGNYTTCNLATFSLNATAVTLPSSGTWSLVGPAGLTIDTPTDPNSTVSGATANTTYTLRWTVSNGGVCPDNTDDVTFLLDANPVATITIDNPATVCEGSAQTINATPDGGAGAQIRWYINNTLNAAYNDMTSINQVFNPGDSVYASIQATDPCFLAPDDTDSSSVVYLSIDNQPTADAGSNLSTCGDTVTLDAATPDYGTGMWSLNGASTATFGSITTATDTNAFVSGISPVGSPLILDWTVTNGTCSDVATITVSSAPIPNPSVTISGTQEVCENTSPGTFTATATDFGSGVSYQWYEGGVAVGTNSSTYTVGTLTAGTTVSVAITSTDACGAGQGDSTGANIAVVLLPSGSISGPTSMCPNTTETLSLTGTADGYQWIMNGGTNLGTAATQSITTGGSYTVDMSNTGGSGTVCTVTVGPHVVTEENITATIFGVTNYSSTVILAEDATTYDMVIDGATNGTPTWSGASVGNIDATNVTDPNGSFEIGTHNLTLTGSSGTCNAVATFTLIVRGPVWVPNAFSPGNEDGSNDQWVPQGLDGWEDWTVRVYNRWGSLVYEQLYEGLPFVPWDGYRSGQPMPVGTYYYVVDVPGAGTFTGPLTIMR